MTKFKIVTDSTVELSNEEIKQYGITVVPLSSMIANILYYDGVTITKAEFLEKMKKSHELPKSSQPAMGTFLDTYNELTADGSAGAFHPCGGNTKRHRELSPSGSQPDARESDSHRFGILCARHGLSGLGSCKMRRSGVVDRRNIATLGGNQKAHPPLYHRR